MPQNINQAIAEAFLAGRPKKIKHTETDGKYVMLHGNVIAARPHKLMLRISLGGHSPTKTTIQRLQFILELSGSGYKIENIYNPEVTRPDGKTFYLKDRAAFYAIPLIPKSELDEDDRPF